MRDMMVRFKEIFAPLLHVMRNSLLLLKEIIPRPLSARTKKILETGMLALTGAVLILFALFFLLRNVVLNRIVDDKIANYLDHHPGAAVHIRTARFSGFDRVVFENIRLQSADKSLALALGSGSVRISFWNILVARLRLDYLELNDLRFDLYPDSVPAAQPGPACRQNAGGGGRRAAGSRLCGPCRCPA